MSNRPWLPADYKLAETMASYWANFAATGDPNGSGIPKWSAFSSINLKVIRLDEKVELTNLPNQKGLEFLEQFFLSKLK